MLRTGKGLHQIRSKATGARFLSSGSDSPVSGIGGPQRGTPTVPASKQPPVPVSREPPTAWDNVDLIHRRAHVNELTAPEPTGSLWDRVFPSKMPRVPMFQPFGMPWELKASTEFGSDAYQLTTLDSGVRVATKQSHLPVSRVGVYFDTGSRHENLTYNGITHFANQMAFKNTLNRSEFRLVRELGKFGATFSSSANREHVAYSGEALRQYTPYLLGTFQDVILHHEFDVKQTMETQHAARDEIAHRNPEASMMEAIHEAAYLTSGLGLSLFPNENSVGRFVPEALKEWVDSTLVASRAVVTGVGVDHNEFVEDVKRIFKFPEGRAGAPKKPATYKGGDLRMHRAADNHGDHPDLTHFTIAFEAPSWNDPDYVAAHLLEHILGCSGKPHFNGAPARGSRSRIREALSKSSWIASASAFNATYSDSGLIGIAGSAAPEHAQQLATTLIQWARGLTTIDASELARAKGQLKAVIFSNMDTAASESEFIGHQIVTYGRVQTPAELAAKVDAVSAADVQRVARKVLSSTPSMAASGDLTFLPRYDQLLK